MPSLVGWLALSAPRFAIILVALFSNFLGRAYESAFWPFVGFLLMPLTTLAYAWAINSRGSVDGLQLVVVVIAVLIDLGLVGGSASGRYRAQYKQIGRT